MGKDKEAKEWVDEWNEKAKVASEKVKEAIGEDVTITVLETMGKDTYVYVQNWGRGTEILYQAFGLKAPDKVVADAFGPGYKTISTEVIQEYVGDYIFLGVGAEAADSAFMETNVWKEILVVQKNNVIQFESESFWFNDAISLENQLEFIVDAFTK